jgi:hypothetical protein
MVNCAGVRGEADPQAQAQHLYQQRGGHSHRGATTPHLTFHITHTHTLCTYMYVRPVKLVYAEMNYTENLPKNEATFLFCGNVSLLAFD